MPQLLWIELLYPILHRAANLRGSGHGCEAEELEIVEAFFFLTERDQALLAAWCPFQEDRRPRWGFLWLLLLARKRTGRSPWRLTNRAICRPGNGQS